MMNGGQEDHGGAHLVVYFVRFFRFICLGHCLLANKFNLKLILMKCLAAQGGSLWSLRANEGSWGRAVNYELMIIGEKSKEQMSGGARE